ncbi:MAG: tripartite tricarboxylate transporter substrate binding protein [Hyphomicrobiaceae bacterium]|nr:tripartite tricarboxylate transporter substrate binding protein [Hyphomicrobiaceae bacterium]
MFEPTLRGAARASALAAIILGGTLSSQVAAQEKYPSRPIDVIVTFGAGGGADLMGRKFSQFAEPLLGVALPVANVSGASGNAGLTRLLTDASDGYSVATLIALSVSAWAAGIGNHNPDEFAYVGMMQSSPSMLFVNKDSPFKTYKDLADFATANPGKLRCATSGYGTMDDITLKYLATKGVKIVNVPFGKPAERYASTVGGHTDLIYEEPGDVAQFLKSGDLRPLIVFDEARHASFPDVSNSKELGLEINDLPNFRTIAVSAKTPADRVAVLNAAANKILASDEWKKFCESTYTCTKALSPDETKARVVAFYKTVKGYLDKFPTTAEEKAASKKKK